MHSHLLPGVDDGADNLATALALARAAVADGITHAVLTPHIHPGRYENTASSLRPAFEQFQRALETEFCAEEPSLQVALAAEVRLTDDLPALLERGEIPFVGEWQGDRILLLELPHSHIPPGTDQLIQWLAKQGIRPLIAHPERNRDVLRNLARLRPLVEADCLFQVTAGAVAGDFGPGAETRARQLLEKDLVTVLASDAHHLERRPPAMSRGRDAAAAIIGESRAQELVLDNPRRLSACQFAENPVEHPA
nr:CpsB/CapC family capsule biosynthesis tyrosine phosphatase [Microbulbifer guangxiensis]